MPYDAPTPSLLKTRYPAFQNIADETVAYWLTDASRFADTSWSEGDYQPALMAVAAHNMAAAGALSIGGNIPAGVTSFRSGSFSVAFSDEAAKLSAEGGFGSTRYGQEYTTLLARNKGGGLITSAGGLPCSGGYRTSLLGGHAL